MVRASSRGAGLSVARARTWRQADGGSDGSIKATKYQQSGYQQQHAHKTSKHRAARRTHLCALRSGTLPQRAANAAASWSCRWCLMLKEGVAHAQTLIAMEELARSRRAGAEPTRSLSLTWCLYRLLRQKNMVGLSVLIWYQRRRGGRREGRGGGVIV